MLVKYRELNTETGCWNSRSSSFREQLPKGRFVPDPVRKERGLVYFKTLRLSTKEGGEACETSFLNPQIRTRPILFRAAERSCCDQKL